MTKLSSVPNDTRAMLLECRLIRVVLAAGRTTRFRSGAEELYIHEDVIRVLHLLFRLKVSCVVESIIKKAHPLPPVCSLLL